MRSPTLTDGRQEPTEEWAPRTARRQHNREPSDVEQTKALVRAAFASPCAGRQGSVAGSTGDYCWSRMGVVSCRHLRTIAVRGMRSSLLRFGHASPVFVSVAESRSTMSWSSSFD
jgi:hypothetical protein